MKRKKSHYTLHSQHYTKGIVFLVGAGPGDPGLITIKGLDALTRAEVVVYDHLVAPRLLDACRPGSRLIYAGKEKGAHAMTQEAINRLLIRHARAGRTVVRLKGGDPFVFGRGGEEALALAKAGIRFDIVPGVSSAIAAPAYAGIPVTHRILSSSVAFVTGHEDPSKPGSTIRWDTLATATDTLVCLMGLSTLGAIARKLIAHGRSKTTPCAVIASGTLPNQRTMVGTLADIERRCRTAAIAPPAALVVGKVVRLRRWLSWFEQKPLFGKRILVTRPGDRAESSTQLLESLGAEVIQLPAIQLAPALSNGAFHRALNEMDRFDWVFFTSPEGIHWFRMLLEKEHKDLRILTQRHIGAIGPKTAAAIEALGIHVDFVPTTFSQEGILEGLRGRVLRGKRALLLSAEGSRDVLMDGLRRLGMQVVRVPIYRSIMAPQLLKRIKEIMQSPPDLVTVTSASCVDQLAAALKRSRLDGRLRQLRFAAIGPVTADAVRAYGGRVAIQATTSTMEGLVDAIVRTEQR